MRYIDSRSPRNALISFMLGSFDFHMNDYFATHRSEDEIT